MKHGELSDRIRQKAVQRYVRPALDTGRNHFSIEVKTLMSELESEGFPPNHPAQFCTAVQTRNFLLEHGLEIEKIDGPPSKKSTTVVVHYRVLRNAQADEKSSRRGEPLLEKENSAAWSRRLIGKLQGLLETELAAYGGAESFVKWVRSEEEKDIV